MNYMVEVLSLRTDGIVAIEVTRPRQVAKALLVPGQVAVEAFHVTLVRLDDLGLSLKTPCPKLQLPIEIGVVDEVRLVASGNKRSCYVEIINEHQELLRDLVRECERALGVRMLDPARIFHITLTNAGGGDPRSSIGSPWAFTSTAI